MVNARDFESLVALFYLQDYSYKEIAAILGLPMGTVKSRLARGLERLHRRLEHRQVRPRQNPVSPEKDDL